MVAVLTHYGIELRGRSAERMARCPFHEDDKPSLQVNVEKNLFTCVACGAGGTVLDFVARMERCSLPRAVEHLLAFVDKAVLDRDAAAEASGAAARPVGRAQPEAARRRRSTRSPGNGTVLRMSLFSLGRLLATPGILESVSADELGAALGRHAVGDWGEVDASDSQANNRALIEGTRILSVYRSSAGIKFWIITEADRSATTVLLPEEY
jgi:hypothetical protein